MSALRLGGSQMAQILVKLSVCLNGLSTFSFIAELRCYQEVLTHLSVNAGRNIISCKAGLQLQHLVTVECCH